MAKDRTLGEVSQKIRRNNSAIIQTKLSNLLKSGGPKRVLEVGFGHGRALLEFAWRFRESEVTFFGVDKKKKPPMERREDLRSIALQYGIAPPGELDHFELPELFFYDATKLHFDDDSVDLVYSAVAIRFMEDKAAFLEEVCRVLAPGGIALLDFGERGWRYPYGRVCHAQILTPNLNRFVLLHGDELIPMMKYLQLHSSGSFIFKIMDPHRCSLGVVKKKAGARLNLLLDLNEGLSLPVRKLPFVTELGVDKGGFRSVYDVPASKYNALFERRMLFRDRLRTDLELAEIWPRTAA